MKSALKELRDNKAITKSPSYDLLLSFASEGRGKLIEARDHFDRFLSKNYLKNYEQFKATDDPIKLGKSGTLAPDFVRYLYVFARIGIKIYEQDSYDLDELADRNKAQTLNAAYICYLVDYKRERVGKWIAKLKQYREKKKKKTSPNELVISLAAKRFTQSFVVEGPTNGKENGVTVQTGYGASVGYNIIRPEGKMISFHLGLYSSSGTFSNENTTNPKITINQKDVSGTFIQGGLRLMLRPSESKTSIGIGADINYFSPSLDDIKDGGNNAEIKELATNEIIYLYNSYSFGEYSMDLSWGLYLGEGSMSSIGLSRTF